MRLIFILPLLLIACSDTSVYRLDKRDIDMIKEQIDEKFDQKLQDITRCLDLARCMGHKTGVIKGEPNYQHYWVSDDKESEPYRRYQRRASGFIESFSYYCSIGDGRVDLKEINPMLNGCRNKKCEKCK